MNVGVLPVRCGGPNYNGYAAVGKIQKPRSSVRGDITCNLIIHLHSRLSFLHTGLQFYSEVSGSDVIHWLG